MKLRRFLTAVTLVVLLAVASLATGCLGWHGGDRDRDRGRHVDRGGDRSHDQGAGESRGDQPRGDQREGPR